MAESSSCSRAERDVLDMVRIWPGVPATVTFHPNDNWSVGTPEAYLGAPHLATLLRAASFAAERHRLQRRKDVEASPYINHPLALATILCSEGGVNDPTVLAAALLHDTVEDTETSLEELRREFGPDVAAIVAEVTDDKSLPKEERKRLQIAHAASKSEGAKLVKLADKIANLRDIVATPPADWSDERREAYFHWAKQVVDGLRGVNSALEAAFDNIHAEGLRAIQGRV